MAYSKLSGLVSMYLSCFHIVALENNKVNCKRCCLQ